MLVPGGRFTDASAAGAGLGPGPGHAVAAEPDPAAWLDQRDRPAAVRARGADDSGGAGVAELVDQPQHRWDRGFSSGPGEQSGPVGQRPGQLVTLSLPGAAAAVAAAVTTSGGSIGSTAMTTSTTSATGSRALVRGHRMHRGRPSRSRERTFPVSRNSRTVAGPGRRHRRTSLHRGAAKSAATCRTPRKAAARSWWLAP